MKKIILSIAFATTLVFTGCKNETKQKNETPTMETTSDVAMTKINFGVRGNCEMCKMTIEKAAKSVEGVSIANWDVKKKKIEVAFDDSKANIIEIHNAIAASGYDTDKVTSNSEAYSNLPSCCQYDHEMTMSQTTEM